jgi:hypothetical protein
MHFHFSESEVFNRLERIALSDKAATPVLGCRLSRALELGSNNKGVSMFNFLC